MAQFEVQWQAPEFEYHEKTVAWYWISIIIAVAIIAFSIWQRNFLFGLFIVIAEIMLIVWGNRTPETVEFKITDQELRIGDKKNYSLKEFDGISFNPMDDTWTELIFQFRARFKTPLKLFFPKDNTDQLRAAMKTILKEIPYEPTLLDSIERLLGF